MSDEFNFFLPLYKVEEQSDGSCLVYTRGTQEIPDASDEVMDYDSTVPEIRKWSEDAYKRSNGLSYGNIRSMHANIAAGKLTESPAYVDSEKAVDLVIKVVDPIEARKCREGIYTGASIGGKYKKRWFDMQLGKYRYTGEPKEFSLVDAPSVPTATFKLVKLDGTQEEKQALGKLEPAPAVMADVENPAVPPVVIIDDPNRDDAVSVATVADTFVSPELIQDDSKPAKEPLTQPADDVNVTPGQAEVLKAFVEAVTQLVALKKADDDEKAKQEAKLKALGARVGIARRDGEPLTPPKDYPTDPEEYGDPANYGYPLNAARVQSAMARFNGGAGKDQYADREWAILGRRIAARASDVFGRKYQYSPKDQAVQANEETQKMTTPEAAPLAKNDVGALINQIAQGINVAADQIGNDPAAAKNMLMALVSSLTSSMNPTPASTTGSSPEAPTGGGQGDGVGKATPTPASTPSSPSTPSMTMATPTPPSPPSTPSTVTAATPPSTPTTPPPPPDSYKEAFEKLAAQMTTLTETVGKLAEQVNKPAPVEKTVPVGDLAALLQAPAREEDPVMKAYLSGDPHALLKAAQLAGTPEHPDVKAVYQRIDRAYEDATRPLFTRLAVLQGIQLGVPELS